MRLGYCSCVGTNHLVHFLYELRSYNEQSNSQIITFKFTIYSPFHKHTSYYVNHGSTSREYQHVTGSAQKQSRHQVGAS